MRSHFCFPWDAIETPHVLKSDECTSCFELSILQVFHTTHHTSLHTFAPKYVNASTSSIYMSLTTILSWFLTLTLITSVFSVLTLSPTRLASSSSFVVLSRVCCLVEEIRAILSAKPSVIKLFLSLNSNISQERTITAPAVFSGDANSFRKKLRMSYQAQLHALWLQNYFNAIKTIKRKCQTLWSKKIIHQNIFSLKSTEKEEYPPWSIKTLKKQYSYQNCIRFRFRKKNSSL